MLVGVAMPGGRELCAQIWQARVGRVPLLLLDTDTEANDEDLRGVTDRLYGGDADHRMRQEILAGIGGFRAVRKYCELTGHPQPMVFHTNEGHAGFLGLERAREIVQADGLAFDEAMPAVRAGTCSPRTPRSARASTGSRWTWCSATSTTAAWCPDIDPRRVLALGAEDNPGLFNMAHMGLRLAQRANGVSQLHGRSRARCSPGCGPVSTTTRCRSRR